MMFMARHANRKHFPWLIAFFAATLTIGLAALVSQ